MYYTFACGTPHMLRTVGEMTWAGRRCGEWWRKDREG
jgi:hypothetical protein